MCTTGCSERRIKTDPGRQWHPEDCRTCFYSRLAPFPRAGPCYSQSYAWCCGPSHVTVISARSVIFRDGNTLD